MTSFSHVAAMLPLFAVGSLIQDPISDSGDRFEITSENDSAFLSCLLFESKAFTVSASAWP